MESGEVGRDISCAARPRDRKGRRSKMDLNQTVDRRPSSGSGDVRRSHHLEFVFESVEGFGASIVAIGLARAWLSLQTGIVAAFDTSFFPDPNLVWVRPVALVAFSAAFAFVRLGPRFASMRRQVCLALGLAGTLLYCAGLYLLPIGGAGSAAATVALTALFCWALRVWCEDNCSPDLRTILIRLCLSFVVQYLFYSIVYLVPGPVQRLVAACSPLLIMGCLCVAPHRDRMPSDSGGAAAPLASRMPDAASEGASRRALTPVNIVTLGIVIAACCASHGLLFSFSQTVSGVWLLGSLVIAGIALGAATSLRGRSLFKGFVCIALVTQCASVVFTLAFPNDADWISLSKSMSYAVSMVLTFSIACYLGASKPAPQAGAYAARWVALYFVAFYCAHLLEQVLRPDTFVSLVTVLLSLVVSAVLMLGNDWSSLVSGAAAETTGLAGRGEGEPGRDGRSDEDCAELCAKLAREHDLTHRETDILAMLLRDVPTRSIAEQSQVSVNTVRSQVQSIYRKLDVHSREELVALVKNE